MMRGKRSAGARAGRCSLGPAEGILGGMWVEMGFERKGWTETRSGTH